MRSFLLPAVGLLLSGAPVLATAQSPKPSAPWPVATPAAEGVNRRVLDSIDAEIRRGDYGYVDRMLVIRGGKIVYDRRYAHDYDAIYADSARTPNPLNAGDLTGPYNYFNPWWHPTYRRGDLHR
jgi:hypothetical protein